MSGKRTPTRSSESARWTREQALLAFQLYCEMPFGQLHGRNAKVVELAALIDRTPGAVAMKCVNFASLDPRIRSSGRRGLSNVSALDRRVWEEFHADWAALLDECESSRSRLQSERRVRDAPKEPGDIDLGPDFTGDTRAALVRLRRGQEFFRRAVLSGYGYKCCISGVTDTRLLVASHIVAWKDDASIRLHPGNGLCLSAIHDKAFDAHLFTLDDHHRVVLSKGLKDTNDRFLRDVFWPVEGSTITLPERFAPEGPFVSRHRSRMQELDEGRPP
jgi:hypothetical protein